MNIITFDAAYSLYPAATFEERTSLWIPASPDVMTPARSNVLAKYAKRGWSFTPVLTPRKSHLFHVSEERFVGDRYTWTVRLSTDNIPHRPRLLPTSPVFNWDPVVQNSWSLSKADGRLFMRYCFLRSYCLRYVYTLWRHTHLAGIEGLLDEQETLEKGKLESTTSPLNLTAIYTW